MTIRVRGPDGVVNNFPDGTSDATITAAMQRHYGAPATLGGTARSFGSGVLKGAAGLADTLNPGGAIDAATKVEGWLGSKLGLITPAQGDRAVAAEQAFRRGSPLETYHERLARSGALYTPRNGLEQVADTAGQFVPNAFSPGTEGAGLVRTALTKGAQILAPTAGATIAPAIVRAAGGGPVAQGVAQVGGAMLGGVAAGGRAPTGADAPRPPTSVTSLSPLETTALTKFTRVAKPDVNAMTGKASAYRGAGIAPTLVDTTGSRGQGVVRALASRPTPAQDSVQAFSDTRAVNLPDRMSTQARNIVSSDPRTPEEIAQDVIDARTAQANKDFDPVRGDPVKVTTAMGQALSSKYGQQAIRRAADRAEADRDPTRGAALNVLADSVASTESLAGAKLTVGQAHDISRALFDRADAATDKGDRDALNTLGATIRDEAKIQSPGYEEALTNFANASQLATAPGVGRQGLTANSTFPANLAKVVAIPGYVDDAGNAFAPQGLALARPGFRRAIEEASGNNTSTAPAVARKIANAPEQQARNEAILGPEDATRLQDNMRLEAEAVQNAANAAPRTGSQTALNTGNAGAVAGDVAGVIGAGVAAGGGHVLPAAMQGLKYYLKATRAFSDDEAGALATMAIDPARHQDAVDFIASRAGPQASQGFASIARQALATNFGAAAPAAAVPGIIAAGNAFGPPGASQPPG